jgi:predicted transcriptional regulator
MGTVQYHLDKLEKTGKITFAICGLYKYYFPSGIFNEREKDLLQILSHETSREVLMFVIEQKNPTQTDIIKSGISNTSVSWHVRRLLELDIIEENREGKYKRYSLRVNPKDVAALLKNYYPNIWDRWTSRLTEMFLSFYEKEENK